MDTEHGLSDSFILSLNINIICILWKLVETMISVFWEKYVKSYYIEYLFSTISIGRRASSMELSVAYDQSSRLLSETFIMS